MGWLNIAIFIYAILMLGGGIGGYVKAHSVPSLVTGIVSAVLLIGAVALAKTNPKVGYMIASLVTLVLVGIFIKRYVETQKVMPSLGLVGLSLLMLGMLIVGHFMGGEKPASPEAPVSEGK